MKRSLTLLIAAVAVASAAALVAISASAISSRFDDGPVYSVAQVVQGIHQDPTRWYGRTVLIQADANPETDSSSFGAVPALPDLVALTDHPSRGFPMYMLLVKYGREDPVLSLLRRLPFIGSGMPHTQQIPGPTTVYTVQLRAPLITCGGSGCVPDPESELVDAAPPMW